MQDMKCFSSSVFNLRHFPDSNGAVCVATLPEWSEHYLLLLNATKISMQKQFLPQPPIASLEILKKMALDQRRDQEDQSLVIELRVRCVCEYAFVTSKDSTPVGVYRRPCEALGKKYRSYLRIPSGKVLPMMMVSAVSMKPSRFRM